MDENSKWFDCYQNRIVDFKKVYDFFQKTENESSDGNAIWWLIVLSNQISKLNTKKKRPSDLDYSPLYLV